MLSVQAPQWTFGTKPTKSSVRTDGPGTADYAPTVGKEKPSYSLTGRNFVREGSSNNTPGPGAYAVKNSKHMRKGPAPSSFSMGKRLPQTGKFTPNPGPSDYSQHTPFRSATGAPRFSPDKHSRNVDSAEFNALESPGPGSYAVTSSEKSGPKYSNRSRLSEKAKAANSPGPAAYSVRGPAATGPKFSMGSSKRFQRSTAENESTPGPGEYVVGKSRGPAFTIQSRVSSTARASQDPGPHTYSPNFTTRKAAPAFSLGGKQSNPELKGNKVPGPGHYALHKKNVDKQGSTVSSSFTMGSRTKTKTTSTTLSPGPAAYTPKKKGGKTIPAFTMRPRNSNASKTYNENSPGPCEYNPSTNNLIKSPYYSFGMKLKK